jgi:hypothetical protein
MSKFEIDFFEFGFLVETCIPPTPIARAMFWEKTIKRHYHRLSQEERTRLFEWINRCSKMQSGIEKGNEDCLLFNARFNPDNQYSVYTNYNNNREVYDAFKWNDRYYTTKDTSIEDKYITKVEKNNETNS